MNSKQINWLSIIFTFVGYLVVLGFYLFLTGFFIADNASAYGNHTFLKDTIFNLIVAITFSPILIFTIAPNISFRLGWRRSWKNSIGVGISIGIIFGILSSLFIYL